MKRKILELLEKEINETFLKQNIKVLSGGTVLQGEIIVIEIFTKFKNTSRADIFLHKNINLENKKDREVIKKILIQQINNRINNSTNKTNIYNILLKITFKWYRMLSFLKLHEESTMTKLQCKLNKLSKEEKKNDKKRI